MFSTDYDRAPNHSLLQDPAARTCPRERPAASSCGRAIASAPAAAIMRDARPIAAASGWWAFCSQATTAGARD